MKLARAPWTGLLALLLLAACAQQAGGPQKPAPAPTPATPAGAAPAAAPTPRPPQAPPPPRGLASHCRAEALLCDAWVQFRRRVPWPYQALGVREAGNGEYLVVISEPPPTASRAELDALLAALFGGTLREAGRARFPTGIDGWLEDTLLRVKFDPQGPMAQVVSGHDLRPWSIPAALATRLQYLHRALMLTREGFHVDDLRALAATTGRPTVPSLGVGARDVDAWLTPARPWQRLVPRHVADDRKPWRQLVRATAPEVFHLPGEGLVALVLPVDTPAPRLAEPLRLYGVATDLQVAAVRADTGNLVLLGRTRRLPLTLMPPMRLETFTMLRDSRARELGQSYERGRIFAGKLTSGPAAGWDWAPIFLSENLEDTELGTLLNLADQVLKSWSQHGDVLYFTFDYPRPAAYPFGSAAASDYFAQQLRTSSLTFNWNTTGFTSWVDMPSGGIVTPDRGSVLPISYLPGNDMNDRRSDAATTRLARDAADRAREVFAAQGDPLLARVAQHVLVFQALGTLGAPKGSGDAATAPAPGGRRYRTEATNDALRQQAERWLAAPEVIAKLEPALAADIGTLRRRMGLSTRQIAELLANPRSRTLSLKEEGLQRARAEYRTLLAGGKELMSRAEPAFAAMCKDVRGTRNKTADGERCNYSWPVGRPLPPSVEVYESLKREVKELEAQLDRRREALLAQEQALDREWERQATAHRIARKVAGKAGDTWEEATVLNAVLDRAATVPATGSIRTPSVVLSRDSKDFYSVGGHNIGAAPTRVLIGERGAKPVYRRVGDDVGLVVAPDQLRATADVVRRGVDETALAADRAPLAARVALELEPAAAADAPLRATLQPAGGQRLSDAEIVRRFAQRDCGTCVLRDADQHLYVLDKGPPTAVRPAADVTALPELIRTARNRREVHFEGLDPKAATLVTESVRVADAQGASGVSMRRLIDGARSVFGQPPGGKATVVSFRDAAGQTHEFTLLGDGAGAPRLLRSRVPTREAQVFEPEGGALAMLQQLGRSGGPGGEPVVTIARFGRGGNVHIDLGVIADHPRAAGSGARQSAVVRDAIARSGTQEAELGSVIAGIRGELERRMNAAEIEFFIKSNAGDIRVVRAPASSSSP